MTNENKIRFKDLSLPLKIIVCGGWTMVGCYAIVFIALTIRATILMA